MQHALQRRAGSHVIVHCLQLCMHQIQLVLQYCPLPHWFQCTFLLCKIIKGLNASLGVLPRFWEGVEEGDQVGPARGLYLVM